VAGSVAPNPLSPNAQSSPIAQVRLNGVFVPITSLTLEKTAYSVADTATATTYCADAPLDYGKTSQTVIPTPFEAFLGNGALQGAKSEPGGRLLYGLLDEIETIYDEDVIELRTRGVLALLIDQRMTARVDMNSTVAQIITKIISQFGLTPKVTETDVPVGKVLQADYVSMARNLRVFDFLVGLTDALGWTIRVQDTTVIVGPPAQRGSVPELSVVWANNTGEKLRVTHSALHTREISVVVKSYLPRLKTRVINSGLSPSTLAILGLPAVQSTSGPKQTAPSGRQSGFTSVGENFSETYVFHIPGLTVDQANAMASKIRDDITRHEFIAELMIAPDPDQLTMLVAAGTEFTVNLSGCSQASHNGLYHPRKVAWEWAVGADNQAACSATITMVNHELPSPASGTI
jgi:hypothetical protein